MARHNDMPMTELPVSDACDVGLAVRGRREVRRFAYRRTVEDPADGVVGWELLEIDSRGASVANPVSMFVVND